MVMRVSVLCSACNNGAPITDPESGELLCSNCGWVLSDKAVDGRTDWRTFGFGRNAKTRAGPHLSLASHDMGLATRIGKTNKDSHGRRLDASMYSTMRRLRIWDFRTRTESASNRNLVRTFDELDGLRAKLGLSDAILEKTAYIYRKALEKRLVRGRSASSVLAAAIYIACREGGASRTLRVLTEITNVKRKAISRSYRTLVRELDIKVPLADPMKCIAKIANKARVSEKTKRAAINAVTAISAEGMSAGKVPMGFAATVLYAACLSNGEKITLKSIADAAGVTEVTVRNRFKDLKARGIVVVIET